MRHSLKRSIGNKSYRQTLAQLQLHSASARPDIAAIHVKQNRGGIHTLRSSGTIMVLSIGKELNCYKAKLE